MPLCFICKVNCSLGRLQNHFNNYHHYNNNQLYKCIETSCSVSFDNYELLRRHYLSDHRLSSSVGSASHTSYNDTNTSKISIPTLQKALHNKILGNFIKLYGSLDLSKHQVQVFFEFIQDITNTGLDMIKNQLETVHKSKKNASEIVADINSLFNAFNESLHNFSTDHNRIALIENTGEYIPPTEFSVGKKFASMKYKAHSTLLERSTDSKAFFFPLGRIFKRVFELPNVYKTISNYKAQLEQKNDKSLITNFIQSNLWKMKTKNFNTKDVFPLFLYYDDFEAGNPLGAHAGVNKMGGTYVTIPCFPPEYQSSLFSVFHALLFYSKDREKYGNFAIFKPLIEELKFLESTGIELDLPEGKKKIYFKLGLILGDNLGLHSLLGLVECFRANFCCRFCTMERSQRLLATLEDEYFLRDKISYDKHLKQSDVSLTGIKQECVFHHLSNFHVVENMAVDIMHDFIEGVCFSDMAAMIKYYIEKGFFTLNDLNNRIKLHDFGAIDADNAPPVIGADNLRNNNIKMSASEMWTFVRHFGIIVGDLIPSDDEVWQLYLNIRQILALVTSTSIQRESSAQLKNLIKEHHWLARHLLNRTLKATDHHLLHYPTVMNASGPLINFWSMRFEAKHQESKISAVVSHTKHNLCKTIARRHQFKLAYMLHFNVLFSKSLTFGPSNLYRIKDLLISFDKTLTDNYYSLDTSINVHKWLNNNGIKYQPDMVLMIEHDDENGPQFGYLKFCCIDKTGIVFFIYQRLISIFNYHFDAYEITGKFKKHRIIKHENLLDVRPTVLIKKNAQNFILLRNRS